MKFIAAPCELRGPSSTERQPNSPCLLVLQSDCAFCLDTLFLPHSRWCSCTQLMVRCRQEPVWMQTTDGCKVGRDKPRFRQAPSQASSIHLGCVSQRFWCHLSCWILPWTFWFSVIDCVLCSHPLTASDFVNDPIHLHSQFKISDASMTRLPTTDEHENLTDA